jgi:hypothetical protein
MGSTSYSIVEPVSFEACGRWPGGDVSFGKVMEGYDNLGKAIPGLFKPITSSLSILFIFFLDVYFGGEDTERVMNRLSDLRCLAFCHLRKFCDGA